MIPLFLADEVINEKVDFLGELCEGTQRELPFMLSLHRENTPSPLTVSTISVNSPPAMISPSEVRKTRCFWRKKKKGREVAASGGGMNLKMSLPYLLWKHVLFSSPNTMELGWKPVSTGCSWVKTYQQLYIAITAKILVGILFARNNITLALQVQSAQNRRGDDWNARLSMFCLRAIPDFDDWYAAHSKHRQSGHPGVADWWDGGHCVGVARTIHPHEWWRRPSLLHLPYSSAGWGRHHRVSSTPQ